MDTENSSVDSRNAKIWVGIAVGTALGIGIVLSRRKKSRWDAAREVSRRVASHSDEVADTTRDLVDRIKSIYDESCQVVAEAGELWSHGRKLVGY